MELGNTIDIGCGIGRVLAWLNKNSIGVDHNPTSIDICVSRNLKAYTKESFQEAIKLASCFIGQQCKRITILK